MGTLKNNIGLFFLKMIQFCLVIFCIVFTTIQCWKCIEKYNKEIIATSNGILEEWKLIECFHFFAFAELASINSTVPVEVTVCANRDISYNKEMLTKYGITEYDSDWFGNQTKLSGDEIFNKVTFDLSALIKVG